MLGKIIGQLLLSVSLFNIVPVDAALLESAVGDTRSEGSLSHLLLSANRTSRLPEVPDRQVPPPKKIDQATYGVETSADSVIVVDVASGETLYAEAANDVRSMGSITKLMSAMVFLDANPELSRSVSLIEDDYVGGGRVYLDFNNPLQLRGVLGASLVGSDNTATQSLARLSGLTVDEFVARMNAKAAGLGMADTTFIDPSGLSSENLSTARDLSTLLIEARTYPVIADFIGRSEYTVTQRSGFSVNIPSTNLLFASPVNQGAYSVIGGKTGYIPQAGYCLASLIEHDGDEIAVVVLGAEGRDDRFIDAQNLAVWSFKTFVWPEL